MKSINGKIDSSNPDHPNFDFSGYQVKLEFDTLISAEDNAQNQTVNQSFFEYCEADGGFRFMLPDQIDFLNDIVTMAVQAPTGQIMLQKLLKKSELKIATRGKGQSDKTSGKVELTIDPLLVEVLSPLETPAKTTGQIIDLNGCAVAEGTRIVFWTCPETILPLIDTDLEDDAMLSQENFCEFNFQSCSPFLITYTDANGQFEIETPLENLDCIYAVWGTADDERSKIDLVNGKFPSQLLLAKRPGEIMDQADDHSCHDCAGEPTTRLPDGSDLAHDTGEYSSDLGGGCNVKFKPNRIMEEISYCSLVRSTEPKISRHTITDVELYDAKTAMIELTADVVKRLQTFKNFRDAANISAQQYELIKAMQAEPASAMAPSNLALQIGAI